MKKCFFALLFILFPATLNADQLELTDVFELEYASDPQISPDGKWVVYVRNFMDVMTDRRRSQLWIIDVDGGNHRPITSGPGDPSSPRWSRDGKRIAYVAKAGKTGQIFCHWLETSRNAQLTQLPSSPSGLSWSPDGRHIAFSMLVEKKPKPLVQLPKPPQGAKWADPPKVIRSLHYRADGKGYLKPGFHHVFVIPAEGGTARQLTKGDFHHKGRLAWMPDGKKIVFSANRKANWRHEPRHSDIQVVEVKTGKITTLTDRLGPETKPVVSPFGQIAYLGFKDRYQGFQNSRLSLHPFGDQMMLLRKFDRSVSDVVWAMNEELIIQYDDFGRTKIAALRPIKNKIQQNKLHEIADDVGGTTIGRPYASGSFSVSDNGVVAYTQTSPLRPADVAVVKKPGEKPKRLTHLNEDLFADIKLGTVESFWFKSSHDKRKIQGWIVKPPNFDPKKKYPLILEIHGGPFANYGPRFSMEMQLYAAAGYVVVYINPRGSTGYGEEFGNLIHHAYPGRDYDDLMSGVDVVIAKGYIDEKNLFVTGGSGGGVLTAWIIGRTGRFRAAVVGKPVINWYSFVLSADMTAFFWRYWFPGYPWENLEHYMKRSPLSLVGNVTTPTMIITGESDHRTPISESEQLYQALKLRKIDAVLVRVPGASHNIAARPSHLMAKVAYVLAWFEKYRGMGK